MSKHPLIGLGLRVPFWSYYQGGTLIVLAEPKVLYTVSANSPLMSLKGSDRFPIARTTHGILYPLPKREDSAPQVEEALSGYLQPSE